MEVTPFGWICGGLILIFALISGILIWFQDGKAEEGISTGCAGGPGCLIAVVLYLLLAHPDNPFVRLAQAPAVSTPTIVKESPRPDYLLSAPTNLELDYNSDDGSGRVSWDASRWMPTKPSLNSKIEYEVFVNYPDNRMGPYRTEKTSYQFDFLNAENTGGVRIEVNAVGIIRDGDNEFRYTGDVVKTSWAPAEK